MPFVPQVEAPSSAQNADGAGVPAPTGVHVPLPERLQASQGAQLVEPQQTPSTQKSPVRQSPVIAHGWPRRFLSPHRLVFGSQMLGGRQSASAVQVALQAEVVAPLHMYGAHAIDAAAWQLPTPSQVLAGVSVEVPVGQEGFAHWVPAA